MERRVRGVALAAVAAALVTVMATVAHAQDPGPLPVDPADPSAPGGPVDRNMDAGENNPDEVPDTDYTPHYKDVSELWHQVGGATFPTTDTVEGSPTDFSDGLFAVSFRNPNRGLAGGQSCHDEQGEVPEPGTEEPGECLPVLYSYSNTAQLGERWDRVDLPGAGQPGHIGAIAWISPTRALAVGGTGVYQRRERELSDEQVATCIAEGVGAAMAAGDDPRSAVTSPQVSILSAAWDALAAQSPEAIAVLEEAGFERSGDNPLHYRPVRSTGSVAANEARAECANRLRQQNDLETGAGEARAWLYDATRSANGGWRELSDEQLPDGMGGLTALDCDPEAGVEFCLAGGLGQIWHWEAADGAGSFTKRIDRNSPANEIHEGRGFRYRVREIRFVPRIESGDRQAFAVTSGCCAGDGLGQASPERGGRLLAYGCSGSECSTTSRRWFVRRYADSLDTGGGLFDEGGRPGGIEAIPLYEPGGQTNRLNYRGDLPDSYYSFTVTPDLALSVLASPGGPERDGEGSVMTQPLCAKRNGLGHSASVAGYSPADWDAAVEATRRHWLSSARLVAGDGDLDRSSVRLFPSNAAAQAVGDASLDPGQRWVGGPSDLTTHQGGAAVDTVGHPCDSGWHADVVPDGVPDWVVGELRSSRVAGRGARGMVHGTNLRPPLQPGTIDSPCAGGPGAAALITDTPLAHCGDPDTAKLADPAYRPTDPEKLRAWLASRYFKLPSYGLAEIDVVGDSGSGWAVGEHGALLRLDEGSLRQQGGAELPPARLGSRRPIGVPDASPYDGRLPSSAGGAAGSVPALATRETQKLERPELVPWGSPDPATEHSIGDGTDRQPRELAISRDGSEGWAVGARRNGQRLTLLRFDGERWSHCEPAGIAGQLEPDPACASLRRLPGFIDKSGRRSPVQLLSMARVPTERDSDPANDDELELVALGTNYLLDESDPAAGEAAAMARYREGRWQLVPRAERAAMDLNPGDGGQGRTAENQIAFATPNEGWIVGGFGNRDLYHYDGQDWVKCSQPEATPECGLTEHNQISGGGTLPLQLTTSAGRSFLLGSRPISNGADTTWHPLVLSKGPGEHWSADSARGGLDPGFDGDGDGAPDGGEAITGHISALAILPRDGGERFEGWAIGDFTTEAVGETALLRLTESGWEPYDDAGPVADAFTSTSVSVASVLQKGITGQLLDRTQAGAYRDADGRPRALFAARDKLFAFDPEHERWEIANGVTPTLRAFGSGSAVPLALAPDQRGGAWVVQRGESTSGPPNFFRFTDHPPEPVFTEAPSPQNGPEPGFTSLAGAPDGTVWLGTASDALYRHRLGLGWDRVRVPGWDPGKVVTRPSEVNAVAVNESGEGVAVGRGGRIARISGQEVRLDAAAGGAACAASPAPPCGTGRSLRAAAVASDGSAMVGGDSLALLWRPGGPGGEFRAIRAPRAAASATITGISMPSPGLAWVATDTGLVFRGTSSGSDWSWSSAPENSNALGDPLSLDDRGRTTPLRAISLDASGEGYAVGDRGLLLYRSGDGEGAERLAPWRRLPLGYRDSLTAIAVDPSGSGEALIGGRAGLILTAEGPRVSVARHGDWVQGPHHLGESQGPVVGLALAPGPNEGESEAWAALAGTAVEPFPGSGFTNTGVNRLLHFASDRDEPLLDTAGGTRSLPDAPPAADGELSMAVLGKSHCQSHADRLCPEWSQATNVDELLAREAVAEIAERAARPGGPDLAVFTGDAVESPGRADEAERGQVRYRRWAEAVAAPLAAAGLPLFAALGGHDLSRIEGCSTGDAGCLRQQGAAAGESGAWRAAMADAPAPWGSGAASGSEGESSEDYAIAPVAGGQHSQRIGDGAATHYAFDLVDDGEMRLRVIFADTSSGSLAGSPDGQPTEAVGQQAWLTQMLCRVGESSPAGPCTRRPGQPAVVVSTSPTYSYGPGQQETAADAAAMESLLLRGGATALVSGRIGWNAHYWTCVAGVHHPQPGGDYPTGPPQPGQGGCGSVLGGGGAQPAAEDGSPELPSNPLDDTAGTGLLPTVISGSAGGPLEPGTSASEGGWHGYSLVRISPDGDPAKTIVEQRPVLDWVALQADSHVVRPGERLALRGFGREPVGAVPPQASIASQEGRFDEISTAAITHRYELLAADADRPWLPQDGEGECAPYACLDPSIGTIDGQSGQVRSGKGNYPRTYAVAQLSVGEQSATYPLVFEPRASFPSPAPPPPVPVAVPAPPPPPAAAPPTTPQVNLPSAPVLPVLTAQALAPPPVPPSPPTFASQAPLDLNLNPASLDVAAPTTVTQPPTPPVNPAPPSGARREARQRQAAAQKSGADSGEEQAEDQGVDLASQPPSADGSSSMSRNEFTAIAHREQPSAWARDALLGGGLGLAALILALGVNTARPTPRRREPELPAPALARQQGRTRR